MPDKQDMRSMLYLLQDEDDEISNNIILQLVEMGDNIAEELEQFSDTSDNPILVERVDYVLHKINFNKIRDQFFELIESDEQSLLPALILIASIEHPDLNRPWILSKISAIKTEIYHKLSLRYSPPKVVEVFNQVFFGMYQMETVRECEPQLFFINHNLSSGRGHPVLIAMLYEIVAHEIKLPIFGMSFSDYFVLAYVQQHRIHQGVINRPISVDIDKIEFYINPENDGHTFTKKDLLIYMKENDLLPRPEYLCPSPRKKLLIHYLNELSQAYLKNEQFLKSDDIEELLEKVRFSS